MNSQTWRRRLLLPSLAAIAALSAASAVDGRRGSESQPVLVTARALPAAVAPRADSQPEPQLELDRLKAREIPEGEGKTPVNVFRAMSWRVEPPPSPPKPVAKAAPPPPPSAPPMPFTFMGRYEDGGARILMLVKGDRIYTVSEGDVIDNTYRVERLAGGNLELMYLPLGIRQAISAEGTP